MQALESLRAAVSGARAAVTGAAGSALHSLPIIGHLTAHDDTRHGVPHFPETGYVGGNAICAAAGKRMEDYLSKRSTKARARPTARCIPSPALAARSSPRERREIARATRSRRRARRAARACAREPSHGRC